MNLKCKNLPLGSRAGGQKRGLNALLNIKCGIIIKYYLSASPGKAVDRNTFFTFQNGCSGREVNLRVLVFDGGQHFNQFLNSHTLLSAPSSSGGTDVQTGLLRWNTFFRGLSSQISSGVPDSF